LRNRIYTGRVSYTETIYRGSLGQGRMARRNREQWFEGKHERIVDDELFDRAMQVRFDARRLNQRVTQVRTYALQDRVYCARCTASKPEDVVDLNFGKMRPNWYVARDIGYYRCHAHNRGYRKCEQSSIPIHVVDDYVVYALFQLEIPVGFQERVEKAVQQQVDNAEALRKMEELNQVAKRVNFSWEQGFLDVDEYMQKRREIEAELAALRPVQYDDLMEAADLIRKFRAYWEKCSEFDEPMKAQRQLLAKIVDRVFIYDDSVIAISLHGDYGIVLDTSLSVPSEIISGLKIKMDTNIVENICVQDGIDGFRLLTGHDICYLWASPKALKSPKIASIVTYFSYGSSFACVMWSVYKMDDRAFVARLI